MHTGRNQQGNARESLKMTSLRLLSGEEHAERGTVRTFLPTACRFTTRRADVLFGQRGACRILSEPTELTIWPALGSVWLRRGVMGQRTPGASAMVSLCCRLSGRQAPVQAPSGGAAGSRTFCGLLDSLPPGQAVGFNPPALRLTW